MSHDNAVRHAGNARQGVFHVERDGKRIAHLAYTREGATVSANHTEVDPAHRGGTLASDLVDALVRWARGEGVKVDPVCPYVRKVFGRTPAYADVQAGGQSES